MLGMFQAPPRIDLSDCQYTWQTPEGEICSIDPADKAKAENVTLYLSADEFSRLECKLAAWESFVKMCCERGFPGEYPGGIVRWAQDKIDGVI